MFVVVAWLIWVFSTQTGANFGNGLALPRLMAAMLGVAFGLWLIGRFGTPNRAAVVTWSARLVCLLVVIGSIGLLLPVETVTAEPASSAGQAPPAAADGLAWQPFSPEAVADARAAGRPVFVD